MADIKKERLSRGDFLKHQDEFIEEVRKKNRINGHPFVEMGDGLKWATCNLGASFNEMPGYYIAWGETERFYDSLDPLTWREGKESGYDYPSNKHFQTGPLKALKYNDADGLKVLELIDDAARADWGGTWRIPTKEEWMRLTDKDNFTWEYTHKESIKGFPAEGYTVTSKVPGYEGNQIFLVDGGCIARQLIVNDGWGAYWSSSMMGVDYGQTSELYAASLRFSYYHAGIYVTEGGRDFGYLIRPVSD